MHLLPNLCIILPILAGTGLLVWNPESRRVRQWYVMSAVLLNSALAFLSMAAAWQGGVDVTRSLLVSFGGNLSISLAIDGPSLVFGTIIAVLWPVTTLYSFEYMKHEGGENRFFSFLTMSYGVVLGVAFAEDFLSLYLFYELLTLATLPLVMHGMDRKARYAGKKYLIYSLSGAAFAFIGIVFLMHYGTTLNFTYGGVLDMSLVRGNENTLLDVFVLAFLGFGVKAAVFPLHGWLPDASVAPTPVSALLHVVAVVKSGVFAILRLIYYGFGTEFLRGTFAQSIVMCFTIVTIVYGSAKALQIPHLKRRLAYSTVSNLSYILFSFTLMTPAGMTGGLTHMAFHAVIKITLFFCAGAVLYKTEKEYVYDLEGFGRAMPVTFAAFTVAAFALAGVPPLGGFTGKWCIASAAVEAGTSLAYAGIGALILSTLLTMLYMMTVVIRAYFPVGEGHDLSEVHDPNWNMTGPLLLLTAGGVALALCSAPLLDFLREVSAGLL